MTAEIVVLNPEGIAMAADSAVTSTLGDIDKISSSANKLFSLSYHHPVGIMVYGNSSFMGVPWETIIKLYRSTSVPQAGLPTLNEYAKHFISFLRYENVKFHPNAESNYVKSFVFDTFGDIRKFIVNKLESESREGKDIDNNDLLRITHSSIDKAYAFYHKLNSEYIPIEQSKILVRRYNKGIQDSIKRNFDGFPLSKNYRSKLKELLIEAFSKSIPDNLYSGVVLAGFRQEEVLPMVRALKIEGIVRFQEKDTELELLKYVDDDDMSSSGNTKAAVYPYAQQEMVCRFMEGVDPDYKEAEMQFLAALSKDYAAKVVSQLDRYNSTEKKKIFQSLSKYGKSMTKEFFKEMQDCIDNYFTIPTVEAVSRLTKSELASMAEALVYITSLKRKVSSDSETVAEPIDVALISKGDGFVWIKRKHYFDPKLNPVYFMNRNEEVNNGRFEKKAQSNCSTK